MSHLKRFKPSLLSSYLTHKSTFIFVWSNEDITCRDNKIWSFDSQREICTILSFYLQDMKLNQE